MMQLEREKAKIALEQCDAEPIHIPGVIQPTAVVLAYDRDSLCIDYLSSNSETLLGVPAQELLGTSSKDFFGSKISHNLRNALQNSDVETRSGPVGKIEKAGTRFSVQVFPSGNHAVVELELIEDAAEWESTEFSAHLAELFKKVNAETSVDGLLRGAVRWLEVLSGYDRVMVYKYLEDWSGEIIAERNNSNQQDYLGLRFPQWDIPKQAREMMARLPMRFIADANVTQVELLAKDAALPPLDLTQAHARGASEVHLMYLRNMGTAATLTLSILVQGELWGMISFHHQSARTPGTRFKAIALPFIEYFNIKLAQLIQSEKDAARESARRILEDARKQHGQGAELASLILDDPAPILDQFKAQGMATFMDGAWQSFGETVSTDALSPILEILASRTEPFSTNCIGQQLDHPAWRDTNLAGVLALPLGNGDAAVIIRKAMDAEVKWAGKPDKDIKKDGASYRLTPRGSFELYLETVSDHAAPWRQIDFELAEGLTALFLLPEQQRRRIETQFYEERDRQQKLMIDELNHRVRNILALIRSVSRQARRSNASLDSYSTALEQRIKALAIAHDLTNDTVLSSVSMREIIDLEMSPYAEGAIRRFTLSGNDFQIRPDLCPIFALVVHELATNAAKYGALSVPDGNVEIELAPHDGGIQVTWTETGGPPVSEPEQTGFGTVLIKNAIPFELNGSAEIEFREAGLIATFWLPGSVALSQVDEVPPKASAEISLANAYSGPVGENLGTALLVEDNYAIALDTEDMLLELGFDRVFPAANVQRALTLLDRPDIDLAVLDMNLGSESSFEIAYEAVARNIPMFFITGYGAEISRPPGLEDIPLITKPIDLGGLADFVRRALYGTAE